MTYATHEDLAAGWRPLSPAEQERATVLLGRASVHIDSEAPDVEARVTATPPLLNPEVPKIVACNMVKRAMMSPVDQPPMTQFQETTGPFSSGGTFANPTGDLYLTKAERRMLGVGTQQAFTVPMTTAPAVTHAPWCSRNFLATYCSCGAALTGDEPLFGNG